MSSRRKPILTGTGQLVAGVLTVIAVIGLVLANIALWAVILE